MGAGASSLPDALSDEQIRALTAESFQENLHKTLQDADGAVPKVLFVNCFEQGVEREVSALFMYCSTASPDKGPPCINVVHCRSFNCLWRMPLTE